MSKETRLGQWWKTPSAQAAMKRANAAKREKILALRARIAERKEQLKSDVERHYAPLTEQRHERRSA